MDGSTPDPDIALRCPYWLFSHLNQWNVPDDSSHLGSPLHPQGRVPFGHRLSVPAHGEAETRLPEVRAHPGGQEDPGNHCRWPADQAGIPPIRCGKNAQRRNQGQICGCDVMREENAITQFVSGAQLCDKLTQPPAQTFCETVWLTPGYLYHLKTTYICFVQVCLTNFCFYHIFSESTIKSENPFLVLVNTWQDFNSTNIYISVLQISTVIQFKANAQNTYVRYDDIRFNVFWVS